MRYLLLLMLILTARPYAARPGQDQPRKWVFRQPKMGSMFAVQTWSADSAAAAIAAANAFRLVDSLNLIFSDYLPESELSRLSASAGSGRFVPVSPALWDILSVSKMAWERSEGTFDVTVGQLTQLWRVSRKSHKLPEAEVLKKALATVGSRYLLLKEHRVRLERPGTRLDLGAIGKGYAAQRMLEAMEKQGFPETLCDAAGNMAIGKSHGGEKWKIGIEIPGTNGELLEKYLPLEAEGISTSGDAYQAVIIDGKSYAHIVSPRTGLGLGYKRQVTIVARDAATADWLSTACYMLPPDKAIRLAASEKAQVLILENTGKGIKTWSSAFKKFGVEE